MARKWMSKRTAKIIFWITVIVLVICIAGLLVFPTLYKSQLRKEITLSDGSLVTNIWKDIPLPIYEKLYFFNVTNGEDFLKGASLNVTEVGPYTYSAKWVKRDPVWNPNGTVSYREIRTYHFVPEMSNGTEEDWIYTLNGPMIIAADILKSYPWYKRLGASFALKLVGENIITRRTIGELAYGGYKDIIILLAPHIKKDIPFKNGKFSWLYGKNDSDDGLFTVFTGADDPAKTDIIDKWNGEEKLNFWKDDTCNMINGTSIETGPPLGDNPDTYSFYQTIFCRSLTFNYTGDKTHHGVLTKRFEPNANIFANGSENPDNACFDLVEGRPSGVLDVRPCQFGAPVLFSFPHFYMADPSYLEPIVGLNPNYDDHGSLLDVEPITGLSVNVKVKFQINLQISHTRGVMQTNSVREGIFPVLWAALEIQITEDWARFLKSQLNNPKYIAYTILSIFTLLSLVLLIVSLVALRQNDDCDEDDPLLNIKEDHKANLSKRTISPYYDNAGLDHSIATGNQAHVQINAANNAYRRSSSSDSRVHNTNSVNSLPVVQENTTNNSYGALENHNQNLLDSKEINIDAPILPLDPPLS